MAKPLENGSPACAPSRAGAALDAPLVGRERDLDELHQKVLATFEGQGGIVLIEAESGGGKTRLVQEYAARMANPFLIILRGQGVDQTAARPFQMLLGVARGLAEACRADSQLTARLNSRLSRQQREALGEIFPELHGALGLRGAHSAGPEHSGETRSIRALCTLLDALGTEKQAALILLDDCQWADEATLQVLQAWCEAGARTQHTLVVSLFRSEDVGPDHPLRRLRTAGHLSLAPLTSSHIERLIKTVLGPTSNQAADLIMSVARGNPFAIASIIQILLESKALRCEGGVWKIAGGDLDELDYSDPVLRFLQKRFRILDEQSLSYLKTAAIMGKEFDGKLVERIVQLPAEQSARILSVAQERHLIRASGDDRYEFAHDRLREALLSLLDESERRLYHLHAAQRLEELQIERIFDLSFHYHMAGDSRKALAFALRAAEEARSRYALAVAEQHYRIAESGAAGAPAETRRRIAEGLGAVLMLRGKYKEAETRFEQARQLVSDNYSAAVIEGMIGELMFKQGYVISALEPFRRAISLLGEDIPPVGLRLFFSIISILARHMLAVTRHKLRPKEGPLPDERVRLICQLYNRYAYAQWFGYGCPRALYANLRALTYLQFRPVTPELVHAVSSHGPGMTFFPFYRRGIRFSDAAVRMARELGDPWLLGQALHFYGVTLYAASRFEECIERLQESIRVLNDSGDRWEANIAYSNLAYAHYRLGLLRQAVAISMDTYREADSIGDMEAAANALSCWSRATGGQIPAAELDKQLNLPQESLQARVLLFQAKGVYHLGRGEFEQAVELLEAGLKLLAVDFRQEYVVPTSAWLLTALRMQLGALAPGSARFHEIKKRMHRLLPAAFLIAWRYRNNMPQTYREAAYLAAVEADERAARRALSRSLASAEAIHSTYEKAQTLLACANIGRQFGWPDAARDYDLAVRSLADCGANLAFHEIEE